MSVTKPCVTAHLNPFFHPHPSLAFAWEPLQIDCARKQDALCDLLVKPALVKHGVVEVNGLGVAAELHIVTNCFDAQLQVPLGVFHHGAAGLRVCVNDLRAKMHNSTESSEFAWEFSQHFCAQWTTTQPYSSRAAPVSPASVSENPATARSSFGRPSRPLGREAVGIPPGRSCT